MMAFFLSSLFHLSFIYALADVVTMSKELIIRTRPCSIELAKQKQKKNREKIEISIFDDTTPTKEKSTLKPVTTFCALFWVIFIYMNAFILPSVLTYLLMTTRSKSRWHNDSTRISLRICF